MRSNNIRIWKPKLTASIKAAQHRKENTPLWCVFLFLLAKRLCSLRPSGCETASVARWVTSKKQLRTVFCDGSPQSKKLAKDFMSDNERLCDWTGICSHKVFFTCYTLFRFKGREVQIPLPQPKKRSSPFGLLFSFAYAKLRGDWTSRPSALWARFAFRKGMLWCFESEKW